MKDSSVFGMQGSWSSYDRAQNYHGYTYAEFHDNIMYVFKLYIYWPQAPSRGLRKTGRYSPVDGADITTLAIQRADRSRLAVLPFDPQGFIPFAATVSPLV